MKTKSIIAAIVAVVVLMSSCTSVKEIGNLNMISTRNVESKSNYVLIKNYAGGSKKELKKSKAETIEDAVNNTVKGVAGGEFLKNTKIFKVTKHYVLFYSYFYAAEGDVWGLDGDITFRGFRKGDKITIKLKKEFKTATIQSFVDDKKCLIKLDSTGAIIEASYDDLTKN